ncbi:DUF3046 domain-containing protein [Kineococcus sp. SYSU DK001]|uniref:DUF3046 domain-containing protein n=1 Tax=Kineococcus sp. SYSU DK001 TaxID=3383122 RepID=UPI003D7ED2E3
MRVSEFWTLVTDEFGDAYGRSLVADQHLLALDDRTAGQALDAGVEPKAIWLALCDAMDVPASRRLGKDPRPPKRR